MLATYVTRGVKAGLVAGLVTALFVALVASPLIGFADGLGHEGAVASDDHGHDHGAEGAADHDHGTEGAADHDHGVVSSALTNVVSVLSGVLWGILLGGVVFGLGFYFLEPAIPGSGSVQSYLLGFAGFVTASGAPWLVLPPQPAGVEQALATGTRLLLYGGMMVAGALVCLLAATVFNRLREWRGPALATTGGILSFGLLAVPVALAPANPVSGTVPDGLAAGLVGVVVFGQLLLWLVLAATHDRLRDDETGEHDDFGTIDVDVAATAD